LSAVTGDGTSLGNLEADVVLEIIVYNVHSSTVLTQGQIRLKHRGSDVDCISTEISHISRKSVLLEDNMRLVALLPIWRIYSYSATVSTYIVSESATLYKGQCLISRYVDCSQSFLTIEKGVHVLIVSCSHHFGASKEISILLFDASSKIKLFIGRVLEIVNHLICC
jgi:hypothetical protein